MVLSAAPADVVFIRFDNLKFKGKSHRLMTMNFKRAGILFFVCVSHLVISAKRRPESCTSVFIKTLAQLTTGEEKEGS